MFQAILLELADGARGPAIVGNEHVALMARAAQLIDKGSATRI